MPQFLPGILQTPRGTQVKLDLIRWDEVDLTVEARLIEVTTATAETEAAVIEDDEIAIAETETNAESVQE